MGKVALLAVLLCVGCATHEMANTCRAQIGNPPPSILGAFGVIGSAINEQSDEKQAYNAKFDACMTQQRAANP